MSTVPRREQDRAATATSSEEAAAPADREEIARLAYAYWEESGYQDGNADEHWYRAEREITTKRKDPAAETAAARAKSSAA